MNYKNFIGIDVAKDKIDVFNLDKQKHLTIANRTKSIEKAFQKIEQADSLVILENTGGYENRCIDVLTSMGFAIHKTHNRKFKKYVESLGQNAKTDYLDSKALAQYGKERQEDLILYHKPDAVDEKLKQLMTYLQELKRIRASEKNRIQSAGYGGITDIIAETLKRLDEMVARIEEEIKELLKKSKAMSKKINAMIKYKGVSLTVALQLMIYLREIGTLSNKKIAALAGLAPYVKESGTMKNHQTTCGMGREKVKRALYMSALSAIRYNPQISKFYKGMLARGKRKMVAIVACMRKMIIHLNAIVRSVIETSEDSQKGVLA